MNGEPAVLNPQTRPSQALLESEKRPAVSLWGRIVTLFKLRVVALLVFASLGGAILGAGGRMTASSIILLLITGTMSAAGASAINQYLERDRDGLMKRTKHRPLAVGQLKRPQIALEVGLALVVLSTLIALPFNPALAVFLGLGALIYVGVYTIWLKPRTLLNIVIGGAAGSCAVLSGGAAVGNWTAPGVILLALLVFSWTPTHFWSLALAYRNDYARADFPMLPVQVSPGQSAGWVFIHALLSGFTALALAVTPGLGTVYLAITLLFTAWYWRQALRLLIKPTGKRALLVFIASNAYLGLVLLTASIAVLFNYYF